MEECCFLACTSWLAQLAFFSFLFPLFFSLLFFSPLSLSLLKDLFIVFYMRHCSCLQTHQKRALDPITDGWEPPCGCWELNSGPLEEQSVLLTTETSL